MQILFRNKAQDIRLNANKLSSTTAGMIDVTIDILKGKNWIKKS